MAEIENIAINEVKSRRLFFLALTISLLGKLLFYSTWPGHEFGSRIAILGLLVLVPRFIAVLSSVPNSYRTFILLFLLCVIVTCFNIYERTYILYPFFFCVCAWNIPLRSIIKVFFLINLVFFIFTLSSSILGIIENKVAEREMVDLVETEPGDTVTRYCFGYNWTTAFAAHVTYLHIMWWYLRKGLLKKKDYLLLVFSIWFVGHYCDARTEMVCMSLIILMSFYYRYRVRKVERLFWFERFAFVCSVPVCAAIMIFLTYQYLYSSDYIYELLDYLMSGRLHLGADAMSDGINMFGRYYIQHGAGSEEGPGSKYFYNFIDCSYLVWLIIYGIFFFTLSVCVFVAICKKSISSKENLTAMSLSILALQGAIVSVFLTFPFNPFYMALFADTSVVLNSSNCANE